MVAYSLCRTSASPMANIASDRSFLVGLAFRKPFGEWPEATWTRDARRTSVPAYALGRPQWRRPE